METSEEKVAGGESGSKDGEGVGTDRVKRMWQGGFQTCFEAYERALMQLSNKTDRPSVQNGCPINGLEESSLLGTATILM